MDLHLTHPSEQDSKTVLVTIQGPTRVVDLQLPTDIPVGELMGMILPLCTTRRDVSEDHNPVWILSRPGLAPFGTQETLADHDIADGTVLLLRDLHEPSVRDTVPAPNAVDNVPVDSPPASIKSRKWIVPRLAAVAVSAAVLIVWAETQHNASKAALAPAPVASASDAAGSARSDTLRAGLIHPAPAPNNGQNSKAAPAATHPTVAAVPTPQKPVTAPSSPAKPQPSKQAPPTVKHNPDQSQFWVNAALQAHSTGNDNAAIADYQKAIQSDPSNATAYVNLGNIYFRFKNNPQTALKYYQQATQVDKSNYYAWINLAECQYALGNKAAAKSTLTTAMHTLSAKYYWSLWDLQQSFG